MSLLIIEHPHGGDPGTFLSVADVMRRPLRRHLSGSDRLPDIDDYQALVIMGGIENIDQQQQYPYLSEEIDYLTRWLDQEKPFLGVCLGAQLLAVASGGKVTRMAETELGWHRFSHTSAASLDPLLTNAEASHALQWHSYIAEPSSEATILAESDSGVQAFRLNQAWGFQFHPEGNLNTLPRWTDYLTSSGQYEEADQLTSGMKQYGPSWRRYGSEIFGRFLALSSESK